MEKLRLKNIVIKGGLLMLILLTAVCHADDLPLENQCQPYIEKAINDLKKENIELESVENEATIDSGQTNVHESVFQSGEQTSGENVDPEKSVENQSENEQSDEDVTNPPVDESLDENSNAHNDDDDEVSEANNSQQNDDEENPEEENSKEVDENATKEESEKASIEDSSPSDLEETQEISTEEQNDALKTEEQNESEEQDEAEQHDSEAKDESQHSNNNSDETNTEAENSKENNSETAQSAEENSGENVNADDDDDSDIRRKREVSLETENEENTDSSNTEEALDEKKTQDEDEENSLNDDESNLEESAETEDQRSESTDVKVSGEQSTSEDTNVEQNVSVENTSDTAASQETEQKSVEESKTDEDNENELESDKEKTLDSLENVGSEAIANDDDDESANSKDEENSDDDHPEEDLLLEFNIPANLRDRTHIAEILHLDDQSSNVEIAVNKAADTILRDLKRIYDNAIKPLEDVYKYRDLSNRHFGDPEIFSKPLVLFMGPWSGGKSTILNYLSENEYTPHSIRSGAEPSPAYFNILMYGDEPEVLDGTQLAADWTFSGLQKFGQGMLDRLRGVKLPNELLKKVNIVEIPGILEVRKQVSRLFPFNDACQWFIDRADIIFLVYDPSKLDVGPETEAILDQLKGREYQTRILLNKADTVKPEELLRVQSALIWNISPLMSSAHPPVLYTVSLWSHPYRDGSPIRLLQAQERALLKDLHEAIEKRIENKIASARRFAVRIRNHAKMVDCYLTTYYNHKTLFANKKQIADHIIENPSHYHIYEGLSTLTNISRYDLPNEDAYRDFFKLNPLYNFKRLAETCTYFRGCPINQLDVAISYQLPELAGKYKKLLEQEVAKIDNENKG